MTLRELISELISADATMLNTEVKLLIDGELCPIEEVKTEEDGTLSITADT